MALSELQRAQVTKRLTATAQRSSSLVASLGITLTVLLSCAANAPGALAKEKDQWAERLTFATGRCVAYLSSAPLREPQPQVQIAIIVVHGLDRDDESNFARISAAARASGKGPVTLVLAPKFKTADDRPGADEHVWSNDGWPSGDLSQDEKDQARRLSSFAVVDRLVSELSAATRFPALRRVVLVGHSAAASSSIDTWRSADWARARGSRMAAWTIGS